MRSSHPAGSSRGRSADHAINFNPMKTSIFHNVIHFFSPAAPLSLKTPSDHRGIARQKKQNMIVTSWKSLAVLLLALGNAGTAATETPGWDIYVSPEGNDRADGTESAPLRTLAAARDKAREIVAPYHAAKTAYDRIVNECFEERSVIGARRMKAWELIDHAKTAAEKKRGQELLDRVNADDKAARAKAQQARKAIDTAKDGKLGTVRINILPGRYKLQETLVLGRQDSGDEGLNIVYQGVDPSNPPVICADTPITGWQPAGDVPHMADSAKGKLWVADLPANLDRIHSLHDGDRLLTESRISFDTDSAIAGSDGGFFRYDLVDKFFYPEGMMRDFENLSDIELAIYPRQRWMHAIMQFESVDTEQRLARTARKLGCGLTRCPGRENASTLLNTIDFLDEPGEWCVNTQTRKIYYWPEGGKPGDAINAPALSELIRVEGDLDFAGPVDAPVTNIHFKNLVLTKADRQVISKDDGLAHSEWAIYDKDNGALRFRGAAYCTVDNLTISNTAGNGIRMDLHAQYITVANSRIFNIGNSAVVILGYGPGRKDVNGFNRVVNCEIHDVGQIHRLGHAVLMCQTHDSIVSNCRIYNTPMNGVSMVGMRYWMSPDHGRNPEYLPVRWQDLPEGARKRVMELNEPLDALGQAAWAGFQPEKFHAEDRRRYESQTGWYDYEDYVHTRNNRVEFCDIYNTSFDLGDSNAIYIHTSNEGNSACHNHVHDLKNSDSGAAMRTDNVQREAEFSHNIIQNIGAHGAFSLSYNTIVRNNYVIDTGRGIYVHQGPWPNTSLIERNICYFSPRDQEASHRVRNLAVHLAKNNEAWKLRALRTDWNLFYSTNYSEEDVAGFGRAEGTIMGPHSRYADPQFEDLKSFKLKSTSPAFALGIEQLDVSRMGLLPEPYKIAYR